MSLSTATRDPDLRQCDSMEELVQLAHEHLDTISPRGIAAFWSLLVKHLQNQRGDGANLPNVALQLGAILSSTMESMTAYDYKDIATIAISLAKVMQQIESRGQKLQMVVCIKPFTIFS